MHSVQLLVMSLCILSNYSWYLYAFCPTIDSSVHSTLISQCILSICPWYLSRVKHQVTKSSTFISQCILSNYPWYVNVFCPTILDVLMHSVQLPLVSWCILFSYPWCLDAFCPATLDVLMHSVQLPPCYLPLCSLSVYHLDTHLCAVCQSTTLITTSVHSVSLPP